MPAPPLKNNRRRLLSSLIKLGIKHACLVTLYMWWCHLRMHNFKLLKMTWNWMKLLSRIMSVSKCKLLWLWNTANVLWQGYTPYSKMAAYKLFLFACLLALFASFSPQNSCLLYMLTRRKGLINKEIIYWPPFWNKVFWVHINNSSLSVSTIQVCILYSSVSVDYL